MSTLTLAVPSAPYKGLAPFEDSELDELLFFGREREREIVAANLVASRLTVLYGPSGVGKTSLLRAAVARELRALPERPAVAVHSAWADDPVAGVATTVAEAAEVEISPSLVETVEHAVVARGEVFLILDQLEEYFLYHGAASEPGTVVDELAEIVARLELPIHVLLGIREDALARLDAFKARMPGLFANSLRLDHLDRDAARRAILGPLERFGDLVPEEQGSTIERGLVEAVLDGVEAGKVLQGPGGQGVVKAQPRARSVETPYLQLVMQRVWEVERSERSRVLRLATLERLGGATRIVEDHLERALGSLTDAQKALAARMLDHLVTPSGTKIAHGAADLAGYTGASESEVADVLHALSRERVLRPVAAEGAGEAHEIFHDVLGPAVLAWRARYLAAQAVERERATSRTRHRRLTAVVVVSLLALAAMAAVAIYAFTQQGKAHDQERAAHARELAARALVQLDVDPEQSLAWALAAAQGEPSQQIEVVLRRALLEARLRRVLQLGSAVALVAYSPDGSEVLLGRANGGGVVWDVRRNRAVRTLDAGVGAVVAAEYDGSGKYLLTAQGRSAVVWDRSSGARLAVIEHRAAIADASFSTDGSRVVTASADGTVRISRARDGEQVRVLRQPGPARRAVLSLDGRALVTVVSEPQGHVQSLLYRGGRLVRRLDRRGVGDVAFSPDGMVLATSNYDGTTRLWDARTGRLVHTLDDGGKAVVDVAFSPDGSLLATASSDGGVRVWRVATGDRFFFLVGHTSPLLRVAFDPTGTFLVSTSIDRSARVWQVAGIEEGKEVALLVGHRQAVLAAAFSPDGRSIVTGSADGSARIWDARIEQALDPVARFGHPVVQADFSPDGRSVVAAASDGTIRVLRAESRRSVGSLREAAPAVEAAFSPDGSLVAAGARDGTVLLWRPGGSIVARLRGDAPLVHVRFAPDGRSVAAAGGRTLRVWRVPRGEPLVALRHPAKLTDAALSHGRAVTATADGVIRIWDVRRGLLLHTLRGHEGAVVRVAFSPTGDVIVSAGIDGTARLWSRDGKLLHVLQGHGAALTDARFDATGTRLVTIGTGSQKNAMVWDVRSGRRLHDLVGHFGTVSAAGFSSDRRWIVTAGPISAVVWSADTGRLLFYLRGHTDLLTSATFSPRGYEVLTSARDGTVRTYDCELCVPLQGLVELARDRLAAAG